MKAELKGELSVGACSRPNGNGERDRLKIEEARLSRKLSKGGGCSFLLKVSFSSDGMLANTLVDSSKCISRNVSDISASLRLQFFTAAGLHAVE